MKPKVLVVRTAGTNCDKESAFAFETAGADVNLRHINYLKKTRDFSGYNIICLPGGFSYGDDLGSGKILALEIVMRLKEALREFIGRGGLIIGICNGFQVLVKTGILPDLDFTQKVTLTFNDSMRFEDRWVNMSVSSESIWLKGLPEKIQLPIAHGEGKFYSSQDILAEIEKNGQVALRYISEDSCDVIYPYNPNGSINNIAGITDKTGRVLGLMPHPERFVLKHHSPFWQKADVVPFGKIFFENAVNYFK
ncbi:MAG: phosphoribosylformylglycinamidine synthase I [Candidatus Omnitrophica bacterium]|jgi:phosphoribosylformylglycinamidine synthase|nr:phosphoribosylformylglycinamidine synthase I [Candidatus Omnitrophota bacterium]MDD5080541.1 phosphoribosylformylglycinamidine synthase I [Candidatus Omnitrophota bacterium]MDD5441493.1 phosphoribosylformylglycinamidine synthase I [Candidatus Omnitrophota bacterium]